MTDIKETLRDYLEASQPVTLDEIMATATTSPIGEEKELERTGTRRRWTLRPVLVGALSAAAVLVLVGGVLLLRPSSQPGPVATTRPEMPTSTIAAVVGYDPETALAQVAEFHAAWNRGLGTPIVDLLHPDSVHRADLDLILIAVHGFHAKVDAACSVTSGAEPDRANVSCLETVDDDFYTAAGIHLTTEVTYVVTADGIDLLEGDPIWAIKPTGIALELLTDFDDEMTLVNGGMVTISGWISLDPSAGSPNWGDGPLRAYSVESVSDAELAVMFLTSEFLHREGDPWEPAPVVSEPVVPTPQSIVSACLMPAELPDGASVDPWLVELHAAVAVLVEHTNALGVSLTETEDFTSAWDQREPVASAVTLVIEDMDAIEAIGAPFGPGDYELFDGVVHYRDAVLPAFFKMRSQGTAIAYFNAGGETQGPCGAAAGAVLFIETMLGLR